MSALERGLEAGAPVGGAWPSWLNFVLPAVSVSRAPRSAPQPTRAARTGQLVGGAAVKLATIELTRYAIATSSI